MASFLSFVAYNFFFIEPIYTLTVAEPHELFALLVFLVVAVFAGSLAGPGARPARKRDQDAGVHAGALRIFAQALGRVKRRRRAVGGAAHLHATFGGRIVLLLAEDGELDLAPPGRRTRSSNGTDMTAARWALRRTSRPAMAPERCRDVAFQFRPLLAPRGAIARLRLRAADGRDQPISRRGGAGARRDARSDRDRARPRPAHARERVKTAAHGAERETARALLSSLSHDLRTPLASIAGAASSCASSATR